MREVLILIEKYGLGHAVAAVRDGLIIDLVIDPYDKKKSNLVGSIMAVKVDAPLKGLSGCFVTMPNGRKGFINENINLEPNTYILAYAGSNTESNKAQPLSRRLILKGKYTILTPGQPGVNFSRSIKNKNFRVEIAAKLQCLDKTFWENSGLIVRSNANNADSSEIISAVKLQIDLCKRFFDRKFAKPEFLVNPFKAKDYALIEWSFQPPVSVIEEIDCFDRFGVWEQISKYLLDKKVLSNGGFMMIESTSAFVAVDINTGSDTSITAAYKTNLLAMKELPRELQIRGLGGKIVIEFAPLAKRHRLRMESELKIGFDKTKIRTNIVGWTKTGNLEIQRKKEKQPLQYILEDDPRFT